MSTLPYTWLTEDTQEEVHLTVTASIGVAVYGLHCTTAEMLLEYADRAMYSAKEQGRNRVCIADIEIMDEQEEPETATDEKIWIT